MPSVRLSPNSQPAFNFIRCAASEWGLQEAEKDVLCRMADCVEPRVSAEARRVVSGMRLARARASVRADRRLTRTSIRTFPEAFSRQNFVLAMECDPE